MKTGAGRKHRKSPNRLNIDEGNASPLSILPPTTPVTRDFAAKERNGEGLDFDRLGEAHAERTVVVHKAKPLADIEALLSTRLNPADLT